MADNPYAVLSGATKAQPAAASPSNPYAVLSSKPPPDSLLGTVAHGAGQVGSAIGSALDAQRFGAWKALGLGNTTDDQMTNVRKKLGIEADYADPKLLGVIPQPEPLVHAERGVLDTAIQTLGDPLTIETLGLGAVPKLGAKLGELGLRAVNATPLGAALHDAFHWGGQVARERGPEVVQQLRGTANLGSASAARVQQHLVGRFNTIEKTLSDEDKVTVGRALNGEADLATLTAAQRSAYRQLRTLTEMDYKMRLRAATAINKAKGMDAATAAHFAEQELPKRTDYMPWLHPKGENLGSKATTKSPRDTFDPRALPRGQVRVTEPGQLRAGFEAMAKNTGRQVESRIIHEHLGKLLDDPAIEKLLSSAIKATGNERTNLEKIKDGWLSIIGYPRAATVSLTPRHAFNILDLAANTVPLADQPKYFAEVMDLARKLALADPKQYAALTKPGRDLGALSGDYLERQAFFQNVPGLRNWTAFYNKLVWAIDDAAKMKYAQLLVERGEAHGLEAGGLASSRLVDYAHRSPMVEALRYVAPFGTFRGSIPGAVLGGVARNPVRSAALNRASGNTFYGGKPTYGQHGVTLYNPTADVGRGVGEPQDYLRSTVGQPVQAAATLAGEGFAGAPGASVRDTASEIQRAPGQVASGNDRALAKPPKAGTYAEAVKLRVARFMTYGNPVDLRWILSAAAMGVPEASTALQQIGASQFKPKPGTPLERGASEFVRQTTGVGVQ